MRPNRPCRFPAPLVAVSMLLGCLVLAPGLSLGEVLVVVNPGVAEDSIEAKDVQRIYLGKRTAWDDQSLIVPVMLKTGPLHEEFVENLVGRSEHRFATYWRQMVFTGKGVPPRSFTSEAEVVGFVKETPGAMGYVSPGTDVTGVKTLTVD